jgi:hypothetical protein
MNMKNAILATGAALLLAVLLSSPTFAQTSNQPPLNAAPAPAPIVSGEPAADVSIDALIDEAQTLEDRAALLRRCVGPPPRPMPAEIAKEAPATEPAVVVSAQ